MYDKLKALVLSLVIRGLASAAINKVLTSLGLPEAWARVISGIAGEKLAAAIVLKWEHAS